PRVWKFSEILIGVFNGLRRIAAVAVLVVLVGTGCRSWVERQFGAVSVDAVSVDAVPAEVATAKNSKSDTEDEGEDKTLERAELEDILADGDGWAEAINHDGENAHGPRWRNRSLEDVLSRSRPDRELLLDTIKGSDNVAAANAAIALVRLGDPSGEKRLAATVRSGRMKLPLRRAAAEAIGSLRSASVVPTLRELIGQYGDFRLDRKSQYVPGLHVELLHGLARHVPPGGDPRFLEALDSPDAKVRLPAVEVWSRMPSVSDKSASELPANGLPDAVADMTGDSDPRVRGAALLAVARRGHRRAEELLEAGLLDGDLHVRIAAIGAIGQWPASSAKIAPAGRAMLLPLLEDRSSMIRAAAVRSLSALGADDDVWPAAKDKKWQVRAAVAESLALKKGTGSRKYPFHTNSSLFHVKEETRKLALDLLADPSLAVQERMIVAVASWPLEAGGPILLEAVERDSPQTRKLAAEQLALVWPSAAHFPFAAPKKRRDEVLGRLRREFQTQYGGAADALGRGGAKDSAAVTPEEITRAQMSLDRLANTRTNSVARRRAVEELAEFGSRLSRVLAAVSIDRQQPLPEIVYEEVLPSCDAVFESLGRFRSDNAMTRRSASAKLAAGAAERRLDRLATARLATLIVRETDQLVWQNSLRAVADNEDEAAVRIAYAAVGHDSAEVRRRACEHLAAWPDARHADVLRPAIEDTNVTVAKAAVVALGRCGSRRDARVLKSVLHKGNAPLRLEAAAVLARMGDADGAVALRRLAHHADPRIRRDVARAMGRSGDAGFIAMLIEMLDDRAGVRREALASLTLLSGYNPAKADGGERKTSVEVIELWKRWQEKQAGMSARRIEDLKVEDRGSNSAIEGGRVQ
ncbi:MAG: HEAT repeat domain-containing protein, partial [Planctomycetota bacterium]|nr:HEAT repeat domain-containing protein [Planctomycetota bacterium]